MKNQKSIKLNFIMNALLSMSSFIFPLITFPYISRILLPEGTGKISFATSVITYFNMIAQLGIPTYGIRACAKVRDDREQLTRTAQELLIINMVTNAVAYALLIISLVFVPKLREEKTLLFVVSLTMILTAIGMEWLYKALEQYTYITVRSVVFKLLALLGMFLLVHEREDYIIYGGITIFASSASNILNLINARRFIGFKPVGQYNLKKHYKPILVFFAMACAVTIYSSLNTVVLGFMKTDADVGYYDAALKIKRILVSIVTSLGTVLLPRATYYFEQKDGVAFRRVTAKALNFVFLVAVPLWVYFTIFSKEGIRFLSGSEYDNAVIPMMISMPTLLLIGVSNITGMQVLVPMGKEKIVLYSEIIGSVVDLILCFALIPRLSSIGAMIALLAAETAVTVYQCIMAKNETWNAFCEVCYTKVFIATLLGAMASYIIKLMSLGNFIKLVLSAVVFFGLYGIVLLLLKEKLTMEIFHQILEKVKAKILCSNT